MRSRARRRRARSSRSTGATLTATTRPEPGRHTYCWARGFGPPGQHPQRNPAPGPVLRGLAQRHQLGALGEALEGALLDLTGPLGRDAELAAGLRERLGLLVAGAEAHL